jgi:quercetin dioxygenase-like cupin family protein
MADVQVRTRVTNLKQFIEEGGFAPVGGWDNPAADLAGYVIKKVVDDSRSKHMINVIMVEPGKGKYSHYHEGGETVWVQLSGKGLYRLDEETEIPVGPGDFFHSFPGEIHGSTNTGDENMYYLCIEGPLPVQMQRDLKPTPYRQGRILNLEWEMKKGGFAPVDQVIPGASASASTDLPGYTIKLLVPMDDPRTKHLIEIVNVEPGFKKYHHYHDNAETVIYFLQGEGEFFLDENTSVPIKAGDVAHALPGEIHGTRNLGNESLRYLVVEGPLPLQMHKAE